MSKPVHVVFFKPEGTAALEGLVYSLIGGLFFLAIAATFVAVCAITILLLLS